MDILKMNDHYMNAKEAAQYLGVKPFTLRQWTRQEKINHYKAGRLLRFKKVDLDKFMQREFKPSKVVSL